MRGATPRRDLDEILQATTRVWPALDKATVLLTGVTGFVGTWMLDALAFARAETGSRISAVINVRSVDRFRTRFPHLQGADWITLYEGDVRQARTPAVTIDFVVHAASAVSPAVLAADATGVSDLILRGTTRVLGDVVERGAQRTLLVSSGSVYGLASRSGDRIREESGAWTDPFLSGRVEVEAKRAAEAIAADFGRRTGMQVVCARGFGMSGPWLPLDGAFALGNFVRDALAGHAIRILGNGKPVRSYLYGGDVAAWLWTLLLHGEGGHPYNVGSEERISLRDLAGLVAELTGRDVDCPNAGVESEPDHFVPDTARAQALSLSARIGVAQAIERMLAWHRE